MRRLFAALLLSVALAVPSSAQQVIVWDEKDVDPPTEGDQCDYFAYGKQVVTMLGTGQEFVCSDDFSPPQWVTRPSPVPGGDTPQFQYKGSGGGFAGAPGMEFATGGFKSEITPWIDVTHSSFGATPGNDGDDDAAAIQAAFDACDAAADAGGALGCTVFIPAGSYKVNSGLTIAPAKEGMRVVCGGARGGIGQQGGTIIYTETSLTEPLLTIGDGVTNQKRGPRIENCLFADGTTNRDAAGGIRIRLMGGGSLDNIAVNGFRNGYGISLEGTKAKWSDWWKFDNVMLFDNQVGIRSVDRVSDVTVVAGRNQGPRATCSEDGTTTCTADTDCSGTCVADCASIGFSDVESGECSVTSSTDCMVDADCPATETCTGSPGATSTDAGGRWAFLQTNFNDWGTGMALGATRFVRLYGAKFENNEEYKADEDCTASVAVNIDSPGGGTFGGNHTFVGPLIQKYNDGIVADADTFENVAYGVLCVNNTGTCITDASDTFDVLSPDVDSKLTRDVYLVKDSDLRLDEASLLYFGADTTLERSGVAELSTNGGMLFGQGTPADTVAISSTGRITRIGDTDADTAERSFVGAEPFPRYIRDVSGVQCVGSGAVLCDTNLYRGAANELKTDDNLFIAGAGRTLTLGEGDNDQCVEFGDDAAGVTAGICRLASDERFHIDDAFLVETPGIPFFGLDDTDTTGIDMSFVTGLEDSNNSNVGIVTTIDGVADTAALTVGFQASDNQPFWRMATSLVQTNDMIIRYSGSNVLFEGATQAFEFLKDIDISSAGGALHINGFTLTDGTTRITVSGGDYSGGGLITASTTDTFTNKSLDGDGTGNAIMIPDGATGAAIATENIAIDDSNQGALSIYDGGTGVARWINVEIESCEDFRSLTTSDTDVPLAHWEQPQKLVGVACCDTDSGAAVIDLEDEAGTSIVTSVSCSACGSALTYTNIAGAAGGTLDAGEGIRFDVTTGVTAGAWTNICYSWRARAQ